MGGRSGHKMVNCPRRIKSSQKDDSVTSKDPVPTSAVAQSPAHRTRDRQEKGQPSASRARLQMGKRY